MRLYAIPIAVAFALTVAVAGQDDPQAIARKELSPRPVTFSRADLPLSKALAELQAQTGNRIADPRREKTNPEIALPAGPLSFWPALDAIGKASGIGFSPYLTDGAVALTESPYRPAAVAYAGLFRLMLRRVSLTRDEETQAHHCQLAVDVAWEPRFRPFYVDLRQLKLTYAPDALQKQVQRTIPAHGAVAAAGRTAVELEVMAGAPDRSSPRIASLEGNVWAVGPSKMLSFSVAKLAIARPPVKPAPVKATQEGVTVALASIRRQTDVLLVTIEIDNPRGNYRFESHQSWLDNNRIRLSSGAGDKQWILALTDSRELHRDDTASAAKIEYLFADQRLPDTLDGWTLEYETPGRMVELTAPFALKDLRLP